MSLLKVANAVTGTVCLVTGAYQGLNLGGVVGDYPPPLSGILGGLAPLLLGVIGTLCLAYAVSKRSQVEYIPQHKDPFDD